MARDIRSSPGLRTGHLVIATLCGLLGVVAGPVVGAAAGPDSGGCAHPTEVYDGELPWAQARLDPDRVWPLSQGSGIRVAVVDTGIDAGNKQLAGRVLPGADVLVEGRGDRQTRDARDDCDGRGTVVAGIIGAAPASDTPFVGVAPGVSLIPVRVTQTLIDPDGQSTETAGGGPDDIAAGIRYATSHQADVICVSTTSTADSAELRAAVSAALDAGIVVVAGGTNPDGGGEGGAVAFPTRYRGVIAVTAVGEDGELVDSSEQGPEIDLAAPGGSVWSTSAGTEKGRTGHVGPINDPAAATAYVAGVAALVTAYHPELTPAQVQQRIETTADHSPAGFRASPIGAGLVDPYAAVATRLDDSAQTFAWSREGSARPFVPPPVVDEAERRALYIASLVSLLIVLGIAAAVAARTARKSGWRSRRPQPLEGPA
jgi:membrane-anchored mycosin MYCP